MSGGHGGGFKFGAKKVRNPLLERFGGAEHHHEAEHHGHAQRAPRYEREYFLQDPIINESHVKELLKKAEIRWKEGKTTRLSAEQFAHLKKFAGLESKLRGTVNDINTLTYEMRFGTIQTGWGKGFTTAHGAAPKTTRSRIFGHPTKFPTVAKPVFKTVVTRDEHGKKKKIKVQVGYKDSPVESYKPDVNIPVLSKTPFVGGIVDAVGSLFSVAKNAATRKSRLRAGTVRQKYERRINALRTQASHELRDLRNEFRQIPAQVFNDYVDDMREYNFIPSKAAQSVLRTGKVGKAYIEAKNPEERH